MKHKTLFSIIVATYNSEKTLESSLESLLEQTYKDWELIVVDGASTDSTKDILKKYEEKIEYFVSEEDSGIYEAMNKGAREAKGEFLYFLNSDDKFYDRNILEFVSQNIDEDIDLITAKVLKIYPKKTILKDIKLNEKNLRKGLMPSHQSMFLRKTVFDSIGSFSTKYKSSADFELCCKLINLNINFKYIDRIIALFKTGGMSGNKKIAYIETYRIIREYFGGFFAMNFYIKKILIEQNMKKIFNLLYK